MCNAVFFWFGSKKLLPTPFFFTLIFSQRRGMASNSRYSCVYHSCTSTSCRVDQRTNRRKSTDGGADATLMLLRLLLLLLLLLLCHRYLSQTLLVCMGYARMTCEPASARHYHPAHRYIINTKRRKSGRAPAI